MNTHKYITKTLLERFSCCLIGNGKKVSGHRILVESLQFLRQHSDLFTKQEQEMCSEQNGDTGVFELRSNKYQNKSKTPNLEIPTQLNTIICNEKQNSINKISCLSRQNAQIHQKFSKIHKKKTQNFLKRVSNKYSVYKSKYSICKNICNNTSSVSDKLAFKKQSNFSFCQSCISCVKPIVETRKRRKGRITYNVPKIMAPRRQEFKGVALLLEGATTQSATPSFSPLLNEISNARSSFNFSEKNIKPTFLTVKSVACDKKSKSAFLLKTNLSPTVNQIEDLYKQQNNLRFVTSSVFSKPFTPLGLSGAQNTISASLKKPVASSFTKTVSTKKITNGLAAAFFDSTKQKSQSVEKKKKLHSFAMRNRAYLHMRWW